MLTSILHRVSGDALAFAALPLLLWWLGAMASGPEAYAQFIECATHPLGYFVLVGISWSFFNHLVSGLRHFVMDIGAGYELNTNKLWSIASPVMGILLTAGFWALALLR